jgi:hypothetical protein
MGKRIKMGNKSLNSTDADSSTSLEIDSSKSRAQRYISTGIYALFFGAIGYYAVRNKKAGIKIGVTLGSAIVGSLVVIQTKNYISKTIAESKKQ